MRHSRLSRLDVLDRTGIRLQKSILSTPPLGGGKTGLPRNRPGSVVASEESGHLRSRCVRSIGLDNFRDKTLWDSLE